MQRYEKYKDSGVEWIGEIPEGWEVKPFKRFARIGNGRDHKHVWDMNGNYPIIGSGGVFGRANKYLYDQPSVILGRKGTIDKPQYVTEPFWTVDTAYFTDIYKNTDRRFFYYLCLTINFDLYKYGSAVPSMTSETLSQIPFCSPRLEEQTTIANYLDLKTAEIDQLIAQKERLVALYEEEKTALINQAVTQGINPKATLKESGIEWLGEIPEHWEAKKLKYVLQFHNNKRIPLSAEVRGKMSHKKYDYYGASGIIDSVDDFIFNGEYILLGEDGANLLTRNTALAFKAAGQFWVNNHAHILTPIYGNLDYYVNLLECLDYKNSVSGSAQPKLTLEALGAVDIVCLPFDEQTAIVQHIETETTRINTKITQTKKIIALQKEYRTALISEVVTGKVKVT